MKHTIMHSILAYHSVTVIVAHTSIQRQLATHVHMHICTYACTHAHAHPHTVAVSPTPLLTCGVLHLLREVRGGSVVGHTVRRVKVVVALEEVGWVVEVGAVLWHLGMGTHVAP